MKIETKYSIGDTVFFLYDNEIHSGVITECSISVRHDTRSEKYDAKSTIHSEGEFLNLKRDMLFETKEALAEKLLSDFSKRTTK